MSTTQANSTKYKYFLIGHWNRAEKNTLVVHCTYMSDSLVTHTVGVHWKVLEDIHWKWCEDEASLEDI